MIRERDFGFTPNASFPAQTGICAVNDATSTILSLPPASSSLQIPFRHQGNAEAGFDKALLCGKAVDKRGLRWNAHIGRELL